MSTPPASPQVNHTVSITAHAIAGSLLQSTAAQRFALATAVLAALWVALLASMSAIE